MERRVWILFFCSVGLGCEPEPYDSSPPDFPGDFEAPAGFWSYSGPERLVLFEADRAYEAGSYSVYDPVDERWIAQGEPSHSDASTACAGAWLLVVNQMFGDNLQFVDPDSGETVAQYSVGNGSNPNAVVFHGEQAFVSLYERDYLPVLRWDTGEELARVDLSPWADADGLPEASQLFVHGGLLWLTLQRLDRSTWTPADEGMLLGIDPESHAVVREIPLGLPNPAGRWSIEGDDASVAANGAYLEAEDLVLDGGLVRVDLSEGVAEPSPLSEALVASNINDAIIRGEHAWLALDDGWAANRMVAWSLEGPTELDTLFEGFTPSWAWDDPVQPRSVWLARQSEGRLEQRGWPDGALWSSVETALFPAWVERCSP
jgi:hypothetical protein